MDVEITPEPTEEERAAILAALARLPAKEDGARLRAWWEAGVREAVEDEEPGGC